MTGPRPTPFREAASENPVAVAPATAKREVRLVDDDEERRSSTPQKCRAGGSCRRWEDDTRRASPVPARCDPATWQGVRPQRPPRLRARGAEAAADAAPRRRDVRA